MDLVLVIPCLNGERYLPATLASLESNRPHLRWWLQDAASKDRSASLARGAAKPSDQVVVQADKGQADAINQAFATCGGEILGWLNADDELLPGAATAVLQYFEENPEIDLVYGGLEWMDEKGQTTGWHQGQLSSLGDVLDLHGCWWGHRQWVQPEVFFRRSLLEKAGPLRTDLHLAFDYDFWVRCLRAGARVGRINQGLARFRIHAEQKSAAAAEASRELREVLGDHLNDPALQFSGARRRLIERRLEYDLWQRGELALGAPLSGKSFYSALLRRPLWFLDPWVQRRIADSLASFLGRKAGRTSV